MRFVLALISAAILAVVLFTAFDPATQERRQTAAYLESERRMLQLERERRTAETLAPLDVAAAAAWRLVPFGVLVAAAALAFDAYRGRRGLVHYGGVPVSRRVIEQDAQLTHATIYGYQHAQIERACNTGVPDRLTVSYAPKLASGGTHAPTLVDSTDAQLAIDVPTFSALLDGGMIGAEQPLLLGYTDQGALVGSWKDVYSAAVAGVSGSGKTSTVRFLAAQAALHGARFVVIDPHLETGDESLSATLAPLGAAMLAAPARDASSILATLQLIHDRLAARLTGDQDRAPILVCVDEFTSLMRDERLAAPLAGLLEALAQQGWKVGIFGILAGQVWNASRSGGTELRDSLASAYVHRIRRNQARLLLNADEARQADALETGQALLLRTNGDICTVAIPHATSSDVDRVGRMLLLTHRSGSGIGSGVVVGTEVDSGMPLPTHQKALNPRAVRVRELIQQRKPQNEILADVWGVTSKGGQEWQQAAAEYRDIVAELAQVQHAR